MYDEDVIKGFFSDCQLRQLSAGTIRHYRSVLRTFTSYLTRNGRGVRDAGREDFKGYIGYLLDTDHSYKTVENHFAALSTLYDYLVYEGLVPHNHVLDIRKRYLKRYKDDVRDRKRKLISVEEMSMLVNSIMDVRDRAMVLLFAKTGLRRRELVSLNINDIDLVRLTATIPRAATKKRSNLTVFFDYETANVLKKWLDRRQELAKSEALFVSSETGERLTGSGVYQAVVKWATKVGLHDPTSKNIENHFTPHCCRHWFTTHLIRAEMRREYVKELRGDARREAMDLYHHIDMEELKKEYLACIPKLGVE
ncbi:MAG: tyrosine-type recombinase/integrase [Candidatus Thermoplasmatota archaeon]|nr:tyrosine-type recombinase/integrase [Candidatus Thermoplasmatota archaeon]